LLLQAVADWNPKLSEFARTMQAQNNNNQSQTKLLIVVAVMRSASISLKKIFIMKENINRCSICSKIVSLEKNGRTEILEQVNGICWSDIGYSIGGWGTRRNFIYSFSGEVCNHCFTALKTKINELKEVIQHRKNSCEEGICIYKKQQNESTGDNVSDLQQNKLQPKRHKLSLLRLLPSFLR
jgi:hypothetical protein